VIIASRFFLRFYASKSVLLADILATGSKIDLRVQLAENQTVQSPVNNDPGDSQPLAVREDARLLDVRGLKPPAR